jgi:hypothetical protein
VDLEPSFAAPVPVALFAYRRHRQLRRTLECLQATGVEQLYVFTDGPEDSAAQADVAKVRELIGSVDWTRPVMIARSENLGLSASIRSGLDWLFERHERVIVIEDDIFVAPEFYDYARVALAHYADAPQVAGITGLRYPFDRRGFDGYPYDTFLSPRFSSWGWASWRDRWLSFEFDHAVLRRALAARADLRPARAGADMPWMIERAVVDESLGGAWDVVCATNMLLHDQYFVTPVWNMVENGGLTEGTHQTGKAPRWNLRWESEHRRALEALRLAPVAEDERVLAAYRKFFALPRRHAVISALARLRRAVGV